MLKRGKKKTKAKPQKAKSDALFAHFRKELKAAAEFIKPNNGLFQFHVTGDPETFWQVNLNKSPGTVRKGKAKTPDATFKISDEHLMKIGQGKMSLQAAFIQGRLKIDGDSGRAMKLGAIISKLPKLEKA
ncbi:MAG: SCP2 sterol-binding domain-containing protein [Bacteroidota bacterium]